MRLAVRTDSYSAVADLDLPDLRNLLETGDVTERLWAAWAYALRRGGESVSDLTAAAMSDPSPGLRRHLIVLLAGFGEGAVIRAFAAHDPDPLVRATACLFLLQCFMTKEAQTRSFLLSILRDDMAAEVRLTILKNAADNQLDIPAEQLTELAADAESDIRRAAISAIADSSLENEAVANGLVHRLGSETEDDILQELTAAACKAGQSIPVLAHAKQHASLGRLELLDFLVNLGEAFPWAMLEDLADNESEALFERAVALNAPSDRALMFSWLADFLSAYVVSAEPYYAQHVKWDLFRKLAAERAPTELSEKTGQDLRLILSGMNERIAALKTEIASFGPEGLDEDDYLNAKETLRWLQSARAATKRLCPALPQ